MTTRRLDTLVRTIIAASGGNQVLAQKTLLEKVLGDERLLRELVAPYLRGIALKKIEQVSGRRVSVPRSVSDPSSAVGGRRQGGGTQRFPAAGASVNAEREFPVGRAEIASLLAGGKGKRKAAGGQKAGYNPMRAAAEEEATLHEVRRPVASPRHVDTMKMLAAVYAARRGEKV